MNNSEQLRDLFAENSLRELLRIFESAFSAPLPAKMHGGWLGMLTLIVLLLTWIIVGVEHQSLDKAAQLLVGYALTVSAALMGVVIAGMAIFASSLKPDVTGLLVATNYPGTQTSSLKFVFAMFAYLLYAMFLTICACGIFYVAVSKDSLFALLLSDIVQNENTTNLTLFVLICYVSLLVGLTIFLLSLLRSFVWNLHQVLLTVAAAGQLDKK